MSKNSDVSESKNSLNDDDTFNELSDSEESCTSYHSLTEEIEKLQTEDVNEFEFPKSNENEVFEDSKNVFENTAQPNETSKDDEKEEFGAFSMSHEESNSDEKNTKYHIDEDYIKDLDCNSSDNEKLKRYEYAIEKKNEGNIKFKEQYYEEAAGIYTEGLQQCPLSYEKDRAILYANRAAARSKLDDEEKKGSIKDCDKAIALDPSYFKAILRRACLHQQLDNLEEALKDFKSILEMDPKNSEAQYAVMTLPKQIEEKNERLKEEMLGKLKELGNMILKPFGLSTNNFQLQQNSETGGYNISFNQEPPQS